MRIFVAGGAGAIGRFLVPALVEQGHETVVLVRSSAKTATVEAMGARSVVADALDAAALTAAIGRAAPEVVVHQLTSIRALASFKPLDQDFALTNRFRTYTTDLLLHAARQVWGAPTDCGGRSPLATGVAWAKVTHLTQRGPI